jgi:hypothetical protein
MNKKKFGLLSAINLVSILMLLIVMGAMPVKASESEKSDAIKENPQSISSRVICPASSLLMHEAQLLRLDYALSDGKGNALGLRNANSFESQDSCNFNLRRLEFVLNDGKMSRPEQPNAAQTGIESIAGINLIRLDYTLSDGKGGAFGLRNEMSTDISGLGEFNPWRLDYALSDGRGNALGLRDNFSQVASKNP